MTLASAEDNRKTVLGDLPRLERRNAETDHVADRSHM